MRYFSTFSGIEAASVAWHNIPGWTPVGFSEIEPFPSAVLAKRFPHVKNYGDITKYREWDIKPGSFDLLVGGSPCQAFSVAGLRKGLTDPRGNLALVFLGMADYYKPKWILWENVPGVLSSNGGRDLGSFLGALAEIGYGACYRVLDAQHFGVAQRRRRIFLVGHLGDWQPAAEVLLEPESLPWNNPESNKTRKGTSSNAKRSARGNSSKGTDSAGGELPGFGGDGNTADIGRVSASQNWDGAPVVDTITTRSHNQSMPDKGNFGSVLQPEAPTVIERAAFSQGINAKYAPSIGQAEVMPCLVSSGPHAVGLNVSGLSEATPSVFRKSDSTGNTEGDKLPNG